MRARSSWKVVLVAAAMGCGGSADSLSKTGGDSEQAGPISPVAGRGTGTGGSTGAGAPGATAPPMAPPPPEIEERRTFETPRAGARFVYVANPRRDSVAVIDSTTLAIRTVEAGDTPTYLTTLPGKDVAVVVNVDSRDATILRTEGTATRTSTVPVVPGANALSVAPGGGHVIAWFDSSARGARATAGSFQDLSVITLAEGADRAVAFTVGFRPTDVAFASDGSAAFVITEDGVSVIRFASVRGPGVAPLVPVGAPAAATAARDVSVTPTGRHALARTEGSSRIQLVDLGSGAAQTLDLGSPVTDLDLAPGGDFAVAVLRQTATVVRIAIPDGFSDESKRVARKLDGETFGSASLTPDGKTAVLYTTAAATPVERLVVVELEGDRPARPVRLKKAVRAVALAPDGKTALVVHTKVPGDPAAPNLDVEVMIDRSYGYSVVELASGFAKLQLTDTDIGPLAITPDAARAFLILRDDVRSVRVVQRIDLASFMVTDFVLGSPPVALAALAESKRVFVSQLHAEGRISFIDWESGAVSSVTGFELNGRIVQ